MSSAEWGRGAGRTTPHTAPPGCGGRDLGQREKKRARRKKVYQLLDRMAGEMQAPEWQELSDALPFTPEGTAAETVGVDSDDRWDRANGTRELYPG